MKLDISLEIESNTKIFPALGPAFERINFLVFLVKKNQVVVSDNKTVRNHGSPAQMVLNQGYVFLEIYFFSKHKVFVKYYDAALVTQI